MWITKKRVIHNPNGVGNALIDLASGHQSFLFCFLKQKLDDADLYQYR